MLKDVKFTGRGVTLRVETDADNSVFEEIFVDKDYKNLDEIIESAKNCIIDVGAHLGFFSIYAACLNSHIPIFALEPDSRNFDILKENLHLNGIKNVVPKNVAVAGACGERQLYLSEDSHNHSLLKFNDEFKECKVNCVNMEKIFGSYLKKYGNIECDLIKMDCEGAEFEILRSFPKEIFKRVKYFYIEYHEYFFENKASELVNILMNSGFSVKSRPSFYDKRMGFIFASRK